jgi:hypothetical protein
MTHLSPDQLLDVAEGTSAEPPHLSSCAACRRELASLRSVMASVMAPTVRPGVPEPSPLFWEHLSSRVSDAVEAAGPVGRPVSVFRRFVFPVAALAAAAALVFAVAVSRRAAPVPAPAAALGDAAALAAAPAEPQPLLVDADDQSLGFLADLAHEIDMDPTLATGLTREDAADHAISHLSEGELRELVELLKAELPRKQVS